MSGRGARLRPPGQVPLARAMSKRGLASRSEAIALVLDGRVMVDGRITRDPGALVVPERVTIRIDDVEAAAPPALTIALHKPRGVVTTRRDPQGRPTVHQLIAAVGGGLSPVGRLDLASTGLLLCTNDTQLAAWLTAPAQAVEREYVVTVRGRLDGNAAARLVEGVELDGHLHRAAAVRVRKSSGRETHLMVTLTEGRNREIRKLCEALGHEVTRLHRVRIGGISLDALAPGAWRIIPEKCLRQAFPGYSGGRSRPPDRTLATRRPPN